MDGIKEKLLPPEADEVEVTLIGGTAGYGESVVIHIGNGYWIVVDSCINSANGKCAPLSYLRDFYGEDEVGKHLKFVICSHWHEDHIKGLSELMNSCTDQTVFVISCADDREKYIYEMMKRCDYLGSSRNIIELIESINKANSKNIKIKKAEQDKLIFNSEGVQCYALSPSENEIKKFNQEIANAHAIYHKTLSQVVKLKKIDSATIEDAEKIEESFFDKFSELIKDKLDEEPVTAEEVDGLLNFKDNQKDVANDRCVAMLLSFNGHHLILGADLEYNEKYSPEGGWQSVTTCACMNNVVANLFKIPHHGSHTGYYDYFLKTFIKPDAVSKLTSWLKGANTLPKTDMLKKYYDHSMNLYITTTSLLKKKNKEKDKTIRDIMNSVAEDIYEYKPSLGLVRSRMKKTSIEDVWQTDFFGSAKKIEKEYLDSLKD